MERQMNTSELEQIKPSIWRKVLLLGIVVAISGLGLLFAAHPKLALEQANLLNPPTPSPTPYTETVPVLMYHYIRVVENPDEDRLGYGLSVTPDNFKAQMIHLNTAGYTTITPDDLWLAIKRQTKLPPK